VADLEDIIDSLLRIADDRRVCAELPRVKTLADNLREGMEEGDPEAAEMSLVRLYTYLHSAGCYYSEREREVLRRRNSYGCYPGGFDPIIKAGPYIREGTVVADLGSGNGLQGLLLQRLYPHYKTIQVEISSEMIRIGRLFQNALGIERDRVEWINDDIMNFSTRGVDFLYIYLPVRPSGRGLELYRAMADELLAWDKPMYIFSIADAIHGFIKDGFDVFYSDGHLTCMERKRP
jgi:SAM-dependent methyltransferase